MTLPKPCGQFRSRAYDRRETPSQGISELLKKPADESNSAMISEIPKQRLTFAVGRLKSRVTFTEKIIKIH